MPAGLGPDLGTSSSTAVGCWLSCPGRKPPVVSVLGWQRRVAALVTAVIVVCSCRFTRLVAFGGTNNSFSGRNLLVLGCC